MGWDEDKEEKACKEQSMPPYHYHMCASIFGRPKRSAVRKPVGFGIIAYPITDRLLILDSQSVIRFIYTLKDIVHVLSAAKDARSWLWYYALESAKNALAAGWLSKTRNHIPYQLTSTPTRREKRRTSAIFVS
jgi:hypothetical protein